MAEPAFTKTEGRSDPPQPAAATEVVPGVPFALTPPDWSEFRFVASESATEDSWFMYFGIVTLTPVKMAPIWPPAGKTSPAEVCTARFVVAADPEATSVATVPRLTSEIPPE